MGEATMVTIDIAVGEELLDALDRAGVKVNAALWTFLSEYEDWRLVISARQFDSPDPRNAYRLLHEALAEAGFPSQRTPTVIILPTSDRFIRELRRIFGKARSVAGMRLGGQMIGDRFVQDAYVYRIT